MDISSAFTPARGLQTRTDGAAYDFRRPGTLGDLSPAVLAQLVSAKVGRTNAARAPREPEYRVTNMPQGGDEAVGRDEMMRAMTRRKAPTPRYSYQFTAPGNAWAGTAPVLPMQTGLPGVEGEDFVLEGGDVRALANFSRGGGESMSPSDDPRMRALVAAQEAARRTPGSIVGAALGRGVRR